MHAVDAEMMSMTRGREVHGTPAIRTSPSSARSAPTMILIRVDFPAPLAPTSPWTVPCEADGDRPERGDPAVPLGDADRLEERGGIGERRRHGLGSLSRRAMSRWSLEGLGILGDEVLDVVAVDRNDGNLRPPSARPRRP